MNRLFPGLMRRLNPLFPRHAAADHPYALYEMSAAATTGGDIDSVAASGGGPALAVLAGTIPLHADGYADLGLGDALGHVHDISATHVASHALPDANSPGAGTGETYEGIAGFTGTGLTKVTAGTYAGAFAVGNHGQAYQGSSGTYPNEPGVAFVDPDTKEKLGEFILAEAATYTIQGVTFRASTETLFVAVKTDEKIYEVDQAGTVVQTIDTAAQGEINGLVYIPETDQLIGTHDGSAGGAEAGSRAAFIYEATGGSYVGTFTMPDGGGIHYVDQLGYAPGAGLLLWTEGANGGDGNVWYVELDTSGADVALKTNGVRGQWATVPEADAIEGVWADEGAGKLWVITDGDYHPATSANALVEYDALPPKASLPVLALAGVTSIDSAGTTRFVLGGDGTPTAVNWALYVQSTGAPQINLNAPEADRVIATWPGVSLHGDHFWAIEIDVAAGTITLMVDGIDQGAPTYDETAGRVALGSWTGGIALGSILVGAAWESGAAARHITGEVYRIGVDTDVDRIEAALYTDLAEITMTATAAAETSTADEPIGTDLLTGALGDRIVTAAGTEISSGGSETVAGVSASAFGGADWVIHDDGDAPDCVLAMGTDYQYLPFGAEWALTTSVAVVTSLAERRTVTATVSGSYTATLYLMPEDGESFSGISGQTDDLTGALPEGTLVKLATTPGPAYGVTSGTVSRIGGGAGDAYLLFGADGYVTYTPSLENLLDDVSFAFVVDENATGVILVTETPTATLEIEVVGFGVVQMTLTQGESEWTVATVCGYVDGKIGFAGRISSDELALIDYGDAAGAEQVEDITGYVPDAYTQTRLGGVAGLEVYGAPLRRGPGIDADQQVTYLDALGAARMDPVRAAYTAADDAFYYDPAAAGGAYQTSGGAAADAAAEPVGYLTDLTGNGYHATQTTAADRPLLQDIGNGSLAMDFDGSSDHLDIPAGAVDPVSVTIIAFEGPATGAQTYLLAAVGSGSENRFYVREEAGGGIVVQVGPQSASTPISVTEGDIYVGIIVSDGTTVTLFLNGTSQSTSCAGATSAYTGRAIGAFPFSAGSWPKMVGRILHMHGEIGVNWTLAEINAAAAAIGARVGADSIAVAS